MQIAGIAVILTAIGIGLAAQAADILQVGTKAPDFSLVSQEDAHFP
jgi:hypothetical protein